MKQGLPHLLVPLRLGDMTLRNRLALAAVTRAVAAQDGTPTPEMATHYCRFARFGVALIVTEATYVPGPASRTYLRQPGMATRAHRDGWKRVVDAVKMEGGHILLQLQHGGAFREPELGPAVGPTTRVPAVPSWQRQRTYFETRRLASGELAELVAGFAEAARLAVTAGFDGVELHGSRGYLLDAFLSGGNDRDDTYGGALENRLRFPSEVVDAVRAELGTRLLSYNLSLYKMDTVEYQPPGGVTEVYRVVEALAERGVDAFHVTTRGLDRCRVGETPLLDLVRAATSRPVIGGGGLKTLAQADVMLRDRRLDMVSMARMLIANPDILERSSVQGASLRPYTRGMERAAAAEIAA